MPEVVPAEVVDLRPSERVVSGPAQARGPNRLGLSFEASVSHLVREDKGTIGRLSAFLIDNLELAICERYQVLALLLPPPNWKAYARLQRPSTSLTAASRCGDAR